MDKYYVLGSKIEVTADPEMNNDLVKKLWERFSLSDSELFIQPGQNFTFCIGDIELPVLKEEKEYALCVTENGIAIAGKDYGGLMRGFMSLLMKIEITKDELKIKTVTEDSNYLMKTRMIHLCVFPETDLYFFKKIIRLAGLCQYTHVVIEFWGMLKYDCMKELSWTQAFTKTQVKEFIDECRMLGMEPVPMFNQLGHAYASRLSSGKHVVLDQNPRLQYLFTPDGWVWDIESDEVDALFKAIRKELYDLFGDGKYMHIGCDEASYVTKNPALREKLPAFFERITSQVENEGRRPLLWMDMLLEAGIAKNCNGCATREESKLLQEAVAKSTVFVDWQYDYLTAPIPTSVSLKDCGHDIIGAPWFHADNYNAHIETITEHNLFGIMLTTWHVLKDCTPGILGCAIKCGAKSFVWNEYSGLPEQTATLLLRLSF